MKLGELLDAILVKLAWIGLTTRDAAVASEGIAYIVGLLDVFGEDHLVKDHFEADGLPTGVPNTLLIRTLASVPTHFRSVISVEDMERIIRLTALITDVQLVLNRYDLASTANGPVPRNLLN